MKSYTWEELCALPIGTILVDSYENEVRYIIMRGPASLCAYLGIPIDHPLAGMEYDALPFSVHGGLTFAKRGGEEWGGVDWPADMYWYGWDYAHCNDYTMFYDTLPALRESGLARDGKRWLVEDIQKEIWSATYDMKKLMVLAEHIHKHKLGWVS